MKDFGEDHGGQDRHGRDTNPPTEKIIFTERGLVHSALDVLHLPCEKQNFLTGIRQEQPFVLISMKELQMKLLLQIFDSLADGKLRDIKRIGSFGDAALFRDMEEDAQIIIYYTI